MYDYSNLNQELLIQLRVCFKNMILLSLAIYLSFIMILKNNYLNYYQNIILLSLISIIVFYMLYIETYQFVYIISIFTDKSWVFDDFTQVWVLELEQNNLRVKQQYFILCLIAKY
jgi:TctA family transporter